MTSPRLSPRSCASFVLTQADVSHVSFVSGFGSSCSHPRFANRPSQTVGSGRKMSSRPPASGWRVGRGAWRLRSTRARCGSGRWLVGAGPRCRVEATGVGSTRCRTGCRSCARYRRCWRRGRRWRGLRCRPERCRLTALGNRRPRNVSVVHRPLPDGVRRRERFARRFRNLPAAESNERACPIVLHDLERPASGLAGEGGQHLVRRVSVVQRRDQRLHQRDRPVVGTRVTPALERVRVGDVPVAQGRGFVLIQPVIDHEADLRQAFAELEVRGRREDRVVAHDHQELHLARVHGGCEFRQRRVVVDRLWLDRSAVGDGRADVAQRLVDRVRGGVHRGGLTVAGDNHRRAAMRLQIPGNCGDPALFVGVGCAPRGAGRGAEGRGKRVREALDVRRAHRQPVIRLGSRQRRCALHDIQPVHRPIFVGDAALVGEIARIANAARPRKEEVGFERQDDIGLVEVVDGVAGRACRLPHTDAGAIPGHRVVLMPARGRVLLQHGRHQLRQRG